jgi:phage terminase small subunit
MSNSLTARQQRFVAEWQTGVDGTEAAKRAGYSPKSARYTAYHLLNENKAVMARIEKVRQALAKAAEYNGQKCMAECDAAMERAIANKNDNAVARLIDLKARISNLLRSQVDVTVEHRPDINAALAAAHARVELRPMCDSTDAIEGEFKALPGVEAVRLPDSQSGGRYVPSLDLNA